MERHLIRRLPDPEDRDAAMFSMFQAKPETQEKALRNAQHQKGFPIFQALPETQEKAFRTMPNK